MGTVDYDPFDPEIIHGDKYAVYRRLRDEAPVVYSEKLDCYALSRFEDVWEACQSPALSSARGTTITNLLMGVQPFVKLLNTMDPPEHSSLRMVLRKRFMPRHVKELAPRVQKVVEELLDALREKESPDFVGDFAEPLATKVGCMVAGFPLEDSEYLRDLVMRFFSRDPGVDGTTERGVAAMAEMDDYFQRLSQERRANPPEEPDAISVIQGWESPDGRRPDDHEVASQMQLLLVGGTDTLPKVLSTLAIRLQEDAAQRRDLAADSSLAVDAVNEAVRIDMPTQNMARYVARPFEVRGQTLEAGSRLLLLYASANRDEREFPDPDRFEMRRRAPRSLSFGHGTHACIGLHVARMEGSIGINELLRRHPNYEIDVAGGERYETEFVQGYSRLPISLDG
jgi:cytochrome P450